MRRYLAAVLLSVAVLTTGCISQDWSVCGPDENCTLLFRYQDNNGGTRFTDNIGSVDVYIFDTDYRFVTHRKVTGAELDQFQGFSLHLDAGVYNVVCWGNMDGGTVSPTIMTATYLDTDDGNGGLPLYYAPYSQPITRSRSRSEADMETYKITVPRKGTVHKDLDFDGVYRTINVLIKGYTDPVTGAEPPMQVEISHLAYSYDFLLQVQPTRKSHVSTTTTMNTPAGPLPGTKVNTPYQEIEDEIDITLRTAAGDPICPPISLKQYLLREGQPLDPLTLKEITVLCEFREGNLTVTLPNWNDNQVGPVW